MLLDRDTERELLNLIVRKRCLSEDESRRVVSQVFSADDLSGKLS